VYCVKGVIMPPCNAYKKERCWLQATAPELYCATCLEKKKQDELSAFIKSIPTIPDSEIISILISRSIRKSLETYTEKSTIDACLFALLKRPYILKEYLGKLTPLLHSILLHRIHNHVRTDLCQVYHWMLRNSLYEDSFLPRNCLKCFAHTIRYGIADNQWRYYEIKRFIRYGSNGEFNKMITNSLLSVPAGIDRVIMVADALTESTLPQDIFATYVDSVLAILTRPNLSHYFNGDDIIKFNTKISTHPFTLVRNLSQMQGMLYKKECIGKLHFKEELIAKTWHPCRFLHWCLDLVEKSTMEIPAPVPLLAKRGEWAIKW